MADKEKTKFEIGELVRYNFNNIQGVQEKLGIVLSLEQSNLYGWKYKVRWTSGDEQEYPENRLIEVG